MSATTTQAPRTTGKTMVLATYTCDEGTRQRVDGLVQITDRRPAGGRSYLVDQGFESMAEVQALVEDYTAKAKRLGYAPMQGWF